MNTLLIKATLARGDFSLAVDLALPNDGITALYGASGSGKSSLLRAIAGLDRHGSTTIRVGETMWQDGDHFVPTHKRNVGYVFQEDNLFPHLNVLRNLRFATKRAGTADYLFEYVVSQLALKPLLKRSPVYLSGGEKQKVAIARSLLQHPSLLLLDEPLSAVDEEFKRGFLPQLKTLLAELSIPALYVTHSSAELGQLADALVYFRQGQSPLATTANALFTDLQGPLALRSDAEAFLDVTVTAHDEAWGLYHLACGSYTLNVGGPTLLKGQQVRLRILAQDVSIALSPPMQSSILNILPVTVLELADHGEHQTTVRLQLDTQVLLARITRKSAVSLGLKAGDSVYAQIKGVAVLH